MGSRSFSTTAAQHGRQVFDSIEKVCKSGFNFSASKCFAACEMLQ